MRQTRSEPESVLDIIQEIIPTPSPTPFPTLPPIPQSYLIPQKLHVFQSFNNCGPATLSMALSYFEVDRSQQELGNILRPYQIPGGDNDDKSVTLSEVAKQATEYGLLSYLRPNGTSEKLKQFIANGIPVVTRTWLKPNEDIGHYRVVRGYDDTSGVFIQDDSLQGKNLSYAYSDFDEIWIPFNYEYLVIVPMDKKETVEKILGEEVEERIAWENARNRIELEIQKTPDNWHLTFALSRIKYYLKDYTGSVEEFNKVENLLSFRTLWYQIEPILAVYQAGDYERVMSLTERILNNHNRAFSELYIIRGDIYKSRGQIDLANQEYQKAIFYNSNLEEAKSRLFL